MMPRTLSIRKSWIPPTGKIDMIIRILRSHQNHRIQGIQSQQISMKLSSDDQDL